MDRIVVNNLSKRFLVRDSHPQDSLTKFIQFFAKEETQKYLWAIQNVSFSIKAGEIVGIIGDNGAGKTTLISLIAGIYTPDQGEIKVHGHIVSFIGLSQAFRIRLTLLDNIYLYCSLFGLTRKTIKEKIPSIIKMAGLQGRQDTKLNQLSMGMISRFIFAIAMHCDPDILLLDEPANNLDQQYVELFKQALIKKAAEGTTIIFVDHNMAHLKSCDRVIWLKKGKILEEGNSREITENYSRLVTQ